jgi:hypothetical protein
MQKIIGRMVHKSLVKSGKSEFGDWKIINFVIEKTFKKKKYKALFVAKGKWADFVDAIAYKERITVYYVIDSKEYAPSKWGTDLRVVEVEKHVPKGTPHVYFGNELVNKEDFEMKQDLHLPLTEKKGDNDVQQ